MTTAADHLREAIDAGCTRDDHDHIADHRAEVLRDGAAQVRANCTSKPGRCGCHTAAALLDLLASGPVLRCEPGRKGATVQETGHEMIHSAGPDRTAEIRAAAFREAADAIAPDEQECPPGCSGTCGGCTALANERLLRGRAARMLAAVVTHCLSCGEGLDDENVSDYCSDKCAAPATEDGAR